MFRQFHFFKSMLLLVCSIWSLTFAYPVYAEENQGVATNAIGKVQQDLLLREQLKEQLREQGKTQLNSLEETKMAYDKEVLKGQKDPSPELRKSKQKIIAGPQGSNLYAMVKIGMLDGKKYGRIANREFYLADESVLKEIGKNLLKPGQKLILEQDNQIVLTLELTPDGGCDVKRGKGKGNFKNPYIQETGGGQVKLQWHHSPNHVGSVSLIPDAIHHGLFSELHYQDEGGKRMGGDAMYDLLKRWKKTREQLNDAQKRLKAATDDGEKQRLKTDVEDLKKRVGAQEEIRKKIESLKRAKTAATGGAN